MTVSQRYYGATGRVYTITNCRRRLITIATAFARNPYSYCRDTAHTAIHDRCRSVRKEKVPTVPHPQKSRHVRLKSPFLSSSLPWLSRLPYIIKLPNAFCSCRSLICGARMSANANFGLIFLLTFPDFSALLERPLREASLLTFVSPLIRTRLVGVITRNIARTNGAPASPDIIPTPRILAATENLHKWRVCRFNRDAKICE